jgi:proline dehydrogenase
MGFSLEPIQLIEYKELLQKSYLYPYWQQYTNGINLSFVNSDQYKDLNFLRSDEKLTTVAIRNDYVSIYLQIRDHNEFD